MTGGELVIWNHEFMGLERKSKFMKFIPPWVLVGEGNEEYIFKVETMAFLASLKIGI